MCWLLLNCAMRTIVIARALFRKVVGWCPFDPSCDRGVHSSRRGARHLCLFWLVPTEFAQLSDPSVTATAHLHGEGDRSFSPVDWSRTRSIADHPQPPAIVSRWQSAINERVAPVYSYDSHLGRALSDRLPSPRTIVLIQFHNSAFALLSEAERRSTAGWSVSVIQF